MTVLYHGSMWKRNDKRLFPGFYMSGELKKWDGTESNKFLYACTDKDEAIRQAVYAMLEGKFRVTGIQNEGKKIVVTANDVVLPKDVLNETVYLYHIPVLGRDEWVKVNNAQNGLSNEWKTPNSVAFTEMHHIHLKQFLRGYEITTQLTKT